MHHWGMENAKGGAEDKREPADQNAALRQHEGENRTAPTKKKREDEKMRRRGGGGSHITCSKWFWMMSRMMPKPSKYPPRPSVPKSSLKVIMTDSMFSADQSGSKSTLAQRSVLMLRITSLPGEGWGVGQGCGARARFGRWVKVGRLGEGWVKAGSWVKSEGGSQCGVSWVSDRHVTASQGKQGRQGREGEAQGMERPRDGEMWGWRGVARCIPR